MKVLMIPWGLPPHYFPQVPLVWAFRAAGHDVRIAAQPYASSAIMASGLTVSEVGHAYDHATVMKENTPRVLQFLKDNDFGKGLDEDGRVAFVDQLHRLVGEVYVRSAEAMLGDLLTLARSWRPDVLVGDPLVLAAPLVAADLGIPIVHHLWGDVLTPQFGMPGKAITHGVFAEDIRRLYEPFGVAPGADALYTLDPCPDDLQVPGVPERRSIRYVPYNGPGVVPEWLTEPASRPRVCVLRSGTTSRIAGTISTVIPQVAAGLTDLGAEVVIPINKADRDALGDLGADVRIAEDLPLHLLLPSCDAIVHHGGSGTMLTAAALGVPQIVIPEINDQSMNGTRLAAIGAGAWIAEQDVSFDSVRSVADKVLTGGAAAEAAAKLAASIAAEPSPAQVVAGIEELV
ncbi:nucleotide disphospho-sugar-binding domain-containing protein [Actinocrispum wychmicini]|uniref:UDP:flavonoid glycosyltransferase YjiC (YdhE family) n=1 Tax=Actinocrispum wychmicini TaxID=1213861 RepID=A0A4R2JNA9_9PSEU|nr:nucleotide disphospho-sugar-binding domain-containing protein [Actinocrispum wychmicini]TCO60804.1 UDP:flavonoid glycosyltransferase YjiC (YdhE family) [Actinocrispum wychmicini]